jgi:hypothetical protein
MGREGQTDEGVRRKDEEMREGRREKGTKDEEMKGGKDEGTKGTKGQDEGSRDEGMTKEDERGKQENLTGQVGAFRLEVGEKFVSICGTKEKPTEEHVIVAAVGHRTSQFLVEPVKGKQEKGDKKQRRQDQARR